MPFLPSEPLSTLLYPRLPFTDSSSSSSSSLLLAASPLLHSLDGGGGPNVPPSQGAFVGLAFSRLLGWLYFSCWIASFVPQTVINYRRKSVTGVSIDYICLNVAGFACYTVFNLSFLLSDTVREEYRQKHQGNDNVARWNDAAFSIWALIFSLIQLGQTFYYKRSASQKLSRFNALVLVAVGIVALVGLLLVTVDHENHLQALDYVLILSYMKLYITLTKYMPQIKVNYNRKSTLGFSIENILLDGSGGFLSLAQLILDASLSHDWSAITGDIPKFGLSLISLGMDAIICVQHFVLYGAVQPKGAAAEEEEVEDEDEGDREAAQGRSTEPGTERTPLLGSERS